MTDRFQRFEQFSFALSGITRYWHKLTADEMEKYGLKGGHSVYLLTLARHPEGITATAMSEICGRDKSDVSRMMAIMEEQELITRGGPGKNKYRAVLRLTDKGHAAADAMRKSIAQAVETAGRDLTEERRTVFYESLRSITDNLRDMAENGFDAEKNNF